MFFRFLVAFFTVATIVLSTWALIGSYKNESYLTNNYLLSFQLSNLNVSALLKDAVNENLKRDYSQVPLEPSVVEIESPASTTPAPIDKRDIGLLTSMIASMTTLQPNQLLSQASQLASLTSAYLIPTSDISALVQSVDPTKIASEMQQIASSLSLPPALVTLASDITNNIGNLGNPNSLLQEVAKNLNASDLGLSDMYSIGFWGYCKGEVKGIKEQIPELGKFGTQFSNKDVNFTYCTPPKVGYTFDPLTVLKTEIINEIKQSSQLVSTRPQGAIVNSLSAQLINLVNLISYNTIGLPGNLQSALPLLGRLTTAGFALILSGAALAFISFLFQMIGMCCSPDNSCLSCLNFFVMFLTFIVVTVGSGLTTGVFLFVRNTLNDEIKKYGIKPYLSVQFYAFSWSAVVASLCLLVFSVIGYCCGCFKSDRSYRRHEPEFRYDHKM